jgi:predicted ArsR family transcriptional regulator
MKGQEPEVLWRALEWIARLPLLGAAELASILKVDERQVRSMLSVLQQRGWVAWFPASSPELKPDRLYTLSSAGVRGLAAALDLSEQDLQVSLPISRRELLHRQVRVETTVGLNRLIADLPATSADQRSPRIEDALILPRRRATTAWWPPDVDAYVCLRHEATYAPFFIAWDRAAAPAAHRRRRVSGWYAFRERQHVWGREDIPTIVLVSAGPAASTQWVRATEASAERRRSRPLRLLLVELGTLLKRGPMAPIWRRAGGAIESPLVDRLAWRWSLPASALVPRLGPISAEPTVLGLSGDQAATWSEASPDATTACGTDGLDASTRRVLEWLAFHPLLTLDEMTGVLVVRQPHVEACLSRMAASGLVASVKKAVADVPQAESRYYLTAKGLGLQAERDGVPVKRYVRQGAATGALPGRSGARLQTLLRQYEHTVGTIRFVVRLIEEARRQGFVVKQWFSAAEASERFSLAGTTRWLHPDGVIEISRHGQTHRLYVEWDRGTMRLPEIAPKLRAYVALCSLPTSTSRLLLVTSTPRRERAIRESLNGAHLADASLQANVLTSVESLVSRLGPCGRVWLNGHVSERVSLAEVLMAEPPQPDAEVRLSGPVSE